MIYNVCTVSQKWVVFDELLVVSNQTITFCTTFNTKIITEWNENHNLLKYLVLYNLTKHWIMMLINNGLTWTYSTNSHEQSSTKAVHWVTCTAGQGAFNRLYSGDVLSLFMVIGGGQGTQLYELTQHANAGEVKRKWDELFLPGSR